MPDVRYLKILYFLLGTVALLLKPLLAQDIVDGSITFSVQGQNCTYVQKYFVEKEDRNSDNYRATECLRELIDSDGNRIVSRRTKYGSDGPSVEGLAREQASKERNLAMKYLEPTLYFVSTLGGEIYIDRVLIEGNGFRAGRRIASSSYLNLGLATVVKEGSTTVTTLTSIESARIDDVGQNRVTVTFVDRKGQEHTRDLPLSARR